MTETSPKPFSASIFISNSQESLHVLQTFTLELDLHYPKEYRPDREALLDHLLRNPGPNELPPFALSNSTQEIVSSEDPTLIHEKIYYLLEPQRPGHHPLTFLEMSFLPNDSAQTEVSIASPLSFVDILPATSNEIDLKALISPLSTLSTTEPIELEIDLRAEIQKDRSSSNVHLFEGKAVPWKPIGALMLFLVITFLIKQVLSRKKSVLSIPASSRQMTALNEAEQSLAYLKQEESPSPNRDIVRVFMSQLIWSLRHYFESEFQLKTSSQTTQEFLDTIQKHPTLGLAQKEALLNFLQIADRIKFANYKPDLKECVEAYATIMRIEQGSHRT
ncbi:MAG: hypothetical protein H0T62_08645 [Parachlamydiaceae bacterium]|nr:hypothetical protein [Parachlamydiaceae bacterium]